MARLSSVLPLYWNDELRPAVMRGDAVLSLLDATFHGAGSIEVLGGALHRRAMDVAGIEMRGASTLVTLICAGEAARLN